MDSTTLWSVLVMVLAVVLIVRGWLSTQARTELIGDLAAAKGWRFNADEPGLVDKWSGEPFGRGDEQRARNVVRGTWHGRKFLAFDYSYQPSSARSNKPPRRFGVITMQLPVALPSLEVEHESLLGEQLSNAIELRRDMRFESEQFNRTFRITSVDERFARAVIHPRLMALLLDRGEIGWRITDEHLLGWYRGSHTPADLERRLDLLAQVADSIPRFVLRDYGNDPKN